MTSVKSVLNSIAIGTAGEISLLEKMFGFSQKRVPSDPCTTDNTAEVSLLDQVRSLRGKHIHLNVIRVGSDRFHYTELDKIDYSIYKTRNIFEAQNLGVGRVEHHDVPYDEADGKDVLGNPNDSEAFKAEAMELIDSMYIPNDGIDVFMVVTLFGSSGVGFFHKHQSEGQSPDDVNEDDLGGAGPDNKNEKDAKSGCIGGDCDPSTAAVARTFAHEIGHYLGLKRLNDKEVAPVGYQINNLMVKSVWGSVGVTSCGSVQLVNWQGEIIRKHAIVRNGCQF